MPYKKYDENLDNVFEVKTREKEEEVKKKEMYAQGETLLKGDDLPAVAALDMTYKPKMKAQPTLQFQTNLDFGSDLPAIAADASWQVGAGEQSTADSIAPTVFQASLPALPSIADSIPSPQAPKQPQLMDAPKPNTAPPPPAPAATTAPTATTAQTPPAAAAAPPPPPPPPAPTPKPKLPLSPHLGMLRTLGRVVVVGCHPKSWWSGALKNKKKKNRKERAQTVPAKPNLCPLPMR